MTNFLHETIGALRAENRTPADVRWCKVSSRDPEAWFTWEEFAELAEKMDYHAGYGVAEIVGVLLIVGDDWWLERSEYDGAEGWEYKTMPIRPERFATRNAQLWADERISPRANHTMKG